MQKQQAGPIPDSYWVRPDKLMAGAYPRVWDDEMSRVELSQLLEAGVTFFLDLTEAGEYYLESYAPLLKEEAAARERSVEHRRMPIRDMDTPTPAEMKHILDTIDTALAAGQVIYLHCFGGIGRTGTVVGCYLVRRGLDGQAALAEIIRLRQGIPGGWKSSPQTEAQREMVREWPVGG